MSSKSRLQNEWMNTYDFRTRCILYCASLLTAPANLSCIFLLNPPDTVMNACVVCISALQHSVNNTSRTRLIKWPLTRKLWMLRWDSERQVDACFHKDVWCEKLTEKQHECHIINQQYQWKGFRFLPTY